MDVERYGQAGGKQMLVEKMAEAVKLGNYSLPRSQGSFHPMVFENCTASVAVRVADVDATDFEQLTAAEMEGRAQAFMFEKFQRDCIPGYENARIIALSVQIGVRETRRVYGEYRLTRDDCMQARRFEDCVLLCGAPIEDHRPSASDEQETAWEYLREGAAYDVPYRALVPKGRDELWIAGRCFSATHDAHASCRSMAQTMSMGQAVGLAAALSLERDVRARDVPTELLQARLTGLGVVVGLWAAVLLARLAGGVARLSRGDLNLARNLVESTKAELAADSALWTAVRTIVNGGPKAWPPDGTVYAWRFGGSEVRVRITDELGRIDINAAPPELLAALFEAAGTEPEEAISLAEAVVEFRDRGIEDPGSLSTGRVFGSAVTAFALTDALAQVPGMPPELQNRIAEAITVYTGQARPRRGVTSPLVLAATGGVVLDEPLDEPADEPTGRAPLTATVAAPTLRRSPPVPTQPPAPLRPSAGLVALSPRRGERRGAAAGRPAGGAGAGGGTVAGVLGPTP